MSTFTNEIEPKDTSYPSIKLLTQKGFQLLYLEYYSFLQDFKAEEISQLYSQGLKYNLDVAHFNSDALQYVKKEIDECAESIEIRKKTCQQKLQKYITPESSALQQALCDYINQNVDLDKDINTDQQLIDLKQKLQQQLEIHPKDMLTEFNLGWVYFHIYKDYRAANVHFGRVVDHNLLDDNAFTEIALRYQALTYHFLDEDKQALSTLQQAASLDQTSNLHYLYEISQQLNDTDEDNDERAISSLKMLIKHSPLFYIHIQSDPFFSDNEKIDQLLARFHAAKLETIKEVSFNKWKDSELMQQPLPQEFNHQQVFNYSYEKHLQLLAHQPYSLLCRTDMISDKIVKNLQTKTKSELKTINKQFTQTIQVEQKKWKIINLLGMTLVYIAVLLTLASIFLFIGSDLLGITGKIGALDWQQLIPKLFTSVLGTGLVGILLLQFSPPKLKKLAKKRSMVINVIE